ncbi:MAG: hypothetical protein ABIW83_01960 [Allosphingosinicella sp.]
MPDDAQRCAICQGSTSARCTSFSVGSMDGLGFACEACGEYRASRNVIVTWLGSGTRLDGLRRAALSHRVRLADRSVETPLITSLWIEEFVKDARLPGISIQMANLLRLIGDYQSRTGEGYFPDSVTDTSVIGSFNPRMFDQLIGEALNHSLIVKVGIEHRADPRGDGMLSGPEFGLTLDGWERYESERRGKLAGRYGFIAMKFNDLALDKLVESAIKPGVKTAVGYDVVHLLNVACAGIIDNILREQIRDAAFILVDLTHDNSGAYWEAGYAEGLGKPVIYICERSKFDRAQTHFDTNHCTTVMWEVGEEAKFVEALVATIRRSLNLF